jgi:hypothetical protein
VGGGPLDRGAPAGAELVDVLVFDEGKDVEQPAARLSYVESPVGVADPAVSPAPGRQVLVELFVVDHAQGELLEVVLALDPARGLACRLHRRKQQRDENADDHDDHQKLDQGERAGFLISD